MAYSLDSTIGLKVAKLDGVGKITPEALANLVKDCGYKSYTIQSASINMDGWLEDVIFYVNTDNVILYWLLGV